MSTWEPKSYWDEHPDYPAKDWAFEVSENNTRESYVDWVNNQIDMKDPEEEEVA